jgi:hypothetical protein
LNIHQDFWGEFALVSKVLYQHNENAEVADVFDMIRELNGGHTLSSAYLAKLDEEVDKEYIKERGKDGP